MKRILLTIALTLLVAASACAGGHTSAPSHAPPPSPPEPSEPASPPPAPPEPGCGDRICTPPDECIRYYGIAGPKLPLFTCGIPCNELGECPDGKRCDTIADGPRLCR
jgi:hypothetical protein